MGAAPPLLVATSPASRSPTWLVSPRRSTRCAAASRSASAKPARLAKALLYVDPQASMFANIAVPLAQLGLADQARAMAKAATDRTARVGQPMARLVANWVGCAVALRLDDVASVDRCTTGLEELVATTTIQQALGPARWFRGWLEMRRGRLREGHALVREGYAHYERVKTYGGCSETLSYAAEALVLLEQWDEAEATLDEAQVLVDRFGERLWVTELLLLRARVAAGRSDAEGERRCIEAALAEARGVQALGAELKAAVALAVRMRARRIGRCWAACTHGSPRASIFRCVFVRGSCSAGPSRLEPTPARPEACRRAASTKASTSSARTAFRSNPHGLGEGDRSP